MPTFRIAAASVVVACAAAGLTACGDDKPRPAATSAPSSSPTSSPTPSRAVEEYVALGDSYSAAPGVPDLVDATCTRSTRNYPNQVAKALGADLADRTCSGAALTHFVERQFGTVPPQLEGLTRETDLVTIGIGANPVLSTALLQGCLGLEPTGSDSPCEHLATRGGKGEDALLAAIDEEAVQLATGLGMIADRSPDARVLVVGYPSIFPATGSCPDRIPLSEADVTYARRIFTALNAMLERVAEANDATYVDTVAATRGHDICADDPWIQDRHDAPGVATFFHPHLEEQQAVAREVLAHLR